MKWGLVIFVTVILVAMIFVCASNDEDILAIICLVGLLLFFLLCLLFPRIGKITGMNAHISAGGLKAGGGFRSELTERFEESNQEFTQNIMSVLPPQWQAEVCGAIEGYTPTMIDRAVDVFIERYILDHLQETPAYWCNVVDSLIAVVCGTVDETGRRHAIAYVTPIARSMAADGQIIFTQTDAGEIVSLPSPPESCEAVT